MILLFAALTSYGQQAGYTPTSLTITPHLDGNTLVEYSMDIDPLLPQVNVTLFGAAYDNLIILDEQSLPLDFTIQEGGAAIVTLGASELLITYSTPDLLSKVGRVWTVSVSSPISFTIRLPSEATVISLSSLPIMVDVRDDQTLITMPWGDQEVGFVAGIVGTKEHALLMIGEAEAVITALKAKGLILTAPQATLADANDAYDEAKYAEAEQLAIAARSSALEVDATASQAQETMSDAQRAIDTAQGEGRTSQLEEAQRLLRDASEIYREGDYGDALQHAAQAEQKAVSSVAPPSLFGPVMLAVIAVAVVGAIVASVFAIKRRLTPPYVKETRRVDAARILDVKPHLRPEEREVVQFLAESGGEAFESEIRERFRLPKTTVWRLVKRLRSEGIVRVEKVGGQNLIRIREDAAR